MAFRNRGNGRGSDYGDRRGNSSRSQGRDDDDNRGALFQNDDKSNDKQPDFKGRIRVDGRDYWISGWEKRSKKGDDYLSLAVTRQDEQRRTTRDRDDGDRRRDGDDRREEGRGREDRDEDRDKSRDRDRDRDKDRDEGRGERRAAFNKERDKDDEIPF